MNFLNKFLGNTILALTARILLGFVFIAAAIDKIALPDAFAKSIDHYQIIPLVLINIFALTLPWLELIVGLFLIFGIRLRASAAITTALLIVFIVAIFSAMVRGLNIECGCFSQNGGGMKVGWAKILEDFLWLALAIYIFFFPNSRFTFDENRKIDLLS